MVNRSHAESTVNRWRQYRVVVVKDYTVCLTVRHTKFLHIYKSLACTLVWLAIQHNYAVVDRNSVCLQNIVKWQKYTHIKIGPDPTHGNLGISGPDPTRPDPRVDPTHGQLWIRCMNLSRVEKDEINKLCTLMEPLITKKSARHDSLWHIMLLQLYENLLYTISFDKVAVMEFEHILIY